MLIEGSPYLLPSARSEQDRSGMGEKGSPEISVDCQFDMSQSENAVRILVPLPCKPMGIIF